jgi:hypothetical protein
MNRLTLATAVAAALALAAPSAGAQMQQPMQEKGPERGPQAQPPPGAQMQPQAQRKGEESGPRGAEKAEPKDADHKGAGPKGAQTEPKDTAPKGSAQRNVEPKEKRAAEPQEKGTKGAAQKTPEPSDKSTRGSAQKAPEPRDKATKGTAEKAPEPKDKGTKGAKRDGSGGMQLSAEQRSNMGQTLLKGPRVNRVTNVNFSLDLGARIPRTIRLAVLPASVVAIVPAYRTYRYFVVDERIVIVEPASYEVVDIIETSGRTAGGDRAAPARLVLTSEERAIILSEIDMHAGGSTLALGALTEGSDVPRGVKVQAFPGSVVDKVPKVRDYKFFTAENRLAIVDGAGTKVLLVVSDAR